MTSVWIKFLCIVSFIVGIICYFLGCNPDYPDQCYNYNVVSGVSVGYMINHNICDKCIKRSKDNIYCTKNDFYECWDTNIKFKYDNNKICYYTIVSNSKNIDYAKAKGASYPINETKKMIKTNNLSCTDFKEGMYRWKAGVAFMLWGCVFLLIIIIKYICSTKNDNNIYIV